MNRLAHWKISFALISSAEMMPRLKSANRNRLKQKQVETEKRLKQKQVAAAVHLANNTIALNSYC